MNELDNSDERLENLEEFKSILVQIETDLRNLPRATKLQAFDEAVLSEEKPERRRNNPKGITLSTIHSAKAWNSTMSSSSVWKKTSFPMPTALLRMRNWRKNGASPTSLLQEPKETPSVEHPKPPPVRRNLPESTSRFVLEFSECSPWNLISTRSLITLKNQRSRRKTPTSASATKVIHKAFGSGIIIAIEGESGQIFLTARKV